MKRFICSLLALTMLCTQFVSVYVVASDNVATKSTEASDIYAMILGDTVYSQDFEGEIEQAFFSSPLFSVVEDQETGNKVFCADASSGFITTNPFGPVMGDCLVEVDIKQLLCSGSTIGHVAVGARTTAVNKNYRFFYSDINRFEKETHSITGTENKRDRLGIARAEATNNISGWHIADISDKNTGVLNLDSRSMDKYYRLGAIAAGNTFTATMSDLSGNVYGELKLGRSDVDKGLDSDMALDYNEGKFTLSAHSTKVYFDNIKVSRVDFVKDIALKPENKVALKGKPLKFECLGYKDEDEIVTLNAEIFDFQYDSENIEIDFKNQTITFNQEGNHEITVAYTDKVNNVKKQYTLDIVAVDSYDFERIELVPEKEYVYLEQQVGFVVEGVMKDGEVYILDENFVVEADKNFVKINDDQTFQILKAGYSELKVSYNDEIRGSSKIHASKYTGGALKLAKDKITTGEIIEYSVFGILDGQETELSEGEYEIKHNQNDLEINKTEGSIKGILTGTHNITAVIDGIDETVELVVEEIFQGVLFSEDFEKGEGKSEFFSIDSQYIVDDGQNKVMRLRDEITPLFGKSGWRNYSIAGRVKIKESKILSDAFNTTFEILLRRVEPAKNMTGGGRGIPYIYRIADLPEDNYMRIGTAPGEKINIDDSQWHVFRAEVIDNQFIFSIDGITQYYSFNHITGGGFQIRATNCEVYFDDIVATKYPVVDVVDKMPVSLDVVKNDITLMQYDSFPFYSITAIKAVYEDGSEKYISNDAQLKWTVLEGEERIDIPPKGNFYFVRNDGNVKSEQNDEVIKVRGEYMGQSCELRLKVGLPVMSETEYIKSGIKTRRENFMQRLMYNADLGTVLTPTDSNFFLAYMFSYIMLHPNERNYDKEMLWHIDRCLRDKKSVAMDVDFFLYQLVILKYMLQGRSNISDEVWDKLDRLLIEVRYATPADVLSENHALMYYIVAFLTGEMFPDAIMDSGKTGRETREDYREYIYDWINDKYKKGMQEFDSGYLFIDLAAMEALYTFTKDADMKKNAENFINYLYTDMCVDSVGDRIAGAHGRTYVNTDTVAKQHIIDLYFDVATIDMSETVVGVGVQGASFGVSEYVPKDILTNMVRDRDKRYISKDRVITNHLPIDPKVTETERKYTYITPNYAMGSIVNRDDYFYTGAVLKGDKYYRDTGTWPDPGTWIATGHQEIPMSLIFPRNEYAHILEGHPGPSGYTNTNEKHNYFSGTYNDLSGRYFQNENVMLGMHKIKDGLPFTHMYIPKPVLELVEEEDGWIFIKEGEAFTAIRPLKDGVVRDEAAYRWGDENQLFTGQRLNLSEYEIKVESLNTAFVMQTVDSVEFDRTFEDFKNEMKKKSVTYSLQGPGYIEFTGLNGKTMRLEYDTDAHFINQQKVDYQTYKKHDSPYMQSEWNTGIINIRYGDDEFNIKPISTSFSSNAPLEMFNEIRSIPHDITTKKRLQSEQQIDEYLDLINQCIASVMDSGNIHIGKAMAAQFEKAITAIMGVAIKTGYIQKKPDNMLKLPDTIAKSISTLESDAEKELWLNLREKILSCISR